ncbi:exodeoxyribonuclease I [Wenzhouxiangella sp. XN79A]|uniref:exodeoxyribonuclease I n=1 Tax=Wenzhouxiangella sp. XN79A TaxID=2724193 RepID=UPI00144AD095|nr:exodeoxyribonuclease I [Wenzhouxiangella sp. XN79A]NKI34100.1 exodeoxyribonuclease I [Wenzhouxiangella sp. XN79A]
MTRETFLWHDYETFGADPRRDRPCQFAALRTDLELEPIGEPIVLYARPASDLLPTPEACLITGITPQDAEEKGVPEYEFARRIEALMSEPGSCAVGYNNFRFDDEVTRFLFWRNFLDPYRREYANGNSRFDLIDLLRMTRALRPEGVEWVNRDDGTPGFRLEDLAAANGFDTEHAHDALADVRNTLGMARRVRTAQPRLWTWALRLRDKATVDGLLSKREVLLHVSSRYPAGEGCIAPVLPLFRHPQIASQWLVWNLRVDPAPFADLDDELLGDLYWTPAADLPEDMQRLPVKWVRTNRCPMLSPTGVLDESAAERTGIDLAAAHRHADRLSAESELVTGLMRVFGAPHSGDEVDPEQALYAGFVPREDRARMEPLATMAPEDAAAWINREAEPFTDPRLNALLLRFAGRHAPDALDPEPRAEWDAWRRRRLVDDPDLASIQIDGYRARLDALRPLHPDRADLLDALAAWPARLGLV